MILSRPILLLALCFIFSAFNLKAEENKVRFTENKGQWNANVNYRAKIIGGQIFLENQKVKYVFYENNSFSKFHLPKDKTNIPTTLATHVVAVNFVGSLKPQSINTYDTFSSYENYFIGSNASKWASHVLAYQKIKYQNIYQNIDLEFDSKEQNFKYSFIVKPLADAADILLQYEGAEKTSISEEGNLVIKTSVGEANELKPYAYQIIDGAKITVPCNYKLHNNKLSFNFPKGYNKNVELIIDPTLIYVTYTGSTSDNWGMTATYDATGNAYTGGIAFGVGYPITTGAIQNSFANGASSVTNQLLVDMNITKYDPTGSTALYSTFLGGNDAEQPQSLVTNTNDELIIYGRTISTDFPVTTGCYDASNNGGYDITVTKFNAAGTSLVGSTYIGGSGNDGVNYDPNEGVLGSLKYNYSDDARGEVVCDAAGNIYVAASTQSSNFPITGGAFQSSYGGTQDGCVVKLNPNLTALIFSSFVGGSSYDAGYAIALDSQNNIFVTGGTSSTNFATTGGTLHTAYQGGASDGFLIKVNNSGSSLLASTYIGTVSYDQSFFVQIDVNDDIYLYGQTEGAYLVTAGVYKNTNGKQFIHKINNALTTTVYSTIFGRGQAQPDIVPSAFLVDDCQNVYISGWGGNLFGYNNSFSTTTGLPVTSNAYKPDTDGSDFYFLGLSKNALALNYATFFGGNSSLEHCDGGTSRFDKGGMIYQSVCAGCGGYSDLPAASGVWSQTNNSFNCNNALIKFQLNFNNTIADFQTSAQYLTGCAPLTVHFQNNSYLGVTYNWDLGDGTTSIAVAPTHVYTTPGIYNVMMIVTNLQSCNVHDTAYGVVTVHPPINITPMPDVLICQNQSTQLNLTTQALSYSWLPPIGLSSTTIPNPVATPSVATNYIVTVTDSNGCHNSDTVFVNVANNSNAIFNLGDTVLCQGETVTLEVSSGYATQQWSNGSTGISITTGLAGIYTVITTDTVGCIDTADIQVLVYPHVIPVVSNDTIICEGDRVDLTASGGIHYVWTPSALFAIDTLQTESVTPIVTTSYHVVISNEACEDSADVTVSVLTNHTDIVTSGPLIVCEGDSVTLDAGAHIAYQWSTGSINQSITVSVAGTYTVTTQTGTCFSSDTAVVLVLPFIHAFNDTAICFGSSANLYVTPVTTNIIWTPSSYLDNANSVSPIATPPSDIVYVVSSVDACKSDSVSIIVHPNPNVDAGNDTTIIYGSQVYLNGYTNETNFWWTPSNELNCDYCLNPKSSTDSTITFALTAVNSFGCTTTDSVKVIVKDIPALYVPNCITPNGDGVNDAFRVYFVGITEIEVEIFNRWGQLIYSWNTLNGYWDAKYKGDIVQEDVYVYTVIATDINLQKIKKMGTVTVIK